MELSKEEVEHIAVLARMGLSDHEKERLRQQLSDILQNMEILGEVDTENVPPTAQSISLRNVFREDESRPSLETKDIMANAPARDGDSFKVRPVLE